MADVIGPGFSRRQHAGDKLEVRIFYSGQICKLNELRTHTGKSTLQAGNLTLELRTAIEVVTFNFVMILFHR